MKLVRQLKGLMARQVTLDSDEVLVIAMSLMLLVVPVSIVLVNRGAS